MATASAQFFEDEMRYRPALSTLMFTVLALIIHGCAVVGPTTGSGQAHVAGGTATVTVSPTTTFSVPVTIGIGDKVAEAAAQAAVGYLTGPVGPITSLLRSEAVQKGIEAGMAKAAETGEPVDRNALKTFLQQVVEKI